MVHRLVGTVLTGVILVASSFLLGAFYNNWIVDHGIFWTHAVQTSSVSSSLAHYRVLSASPAWYSSLLAGLALSALAAAVTKVFIVGVESMLFDGACAVLLAAGILVYGTNVRAVFNFLPELTSPSTITPATIVPAGSEPSDSFVQWAPAIEGLKSLASSHMIIAVSLTGVIALQAAASYSDKAVPIPPSAPPTPKLAQAGGFQLPARKGSIGQVPGGRVESVRLGSPSPSASGKAKKRKAK